MKLTFAITYDIPDGERCNSCPCFSPGYGGHADKPNECRMFGVNSWHHNFGYEANPLKYLDCLKAKDGDLYAHIQGEESYTLYREEEKE